MKKLNEKIKKGLLELNQKSMNKIEEEIEQKQLGIDCPDKKELEEYCARTGLSITPALGIFMTGALCVLLMSICGITDKIIIASVLAVLLPLSSWSYFSLMTKMLKSDFINNKKEELSQLMEKRNQIDKNKNLINYNNIPEEYENEIISKEMLEELTEHIENKEILDMIFSKNEKMEINYKQADMLFNLKKATISKEILENCAMVYQS